MAINRIGAGSVQQQSREFKSTLDKDAFLNLLVTQLKNQNPLQPMENTEFIAQMAQFTSLEQAQNTNKNIKLDSAYNLVNKFVTATHTDKETEETKEITGVVSKVKVEGENIILVINNTDVPFEKVTEVTDPISPYEQMQVINQNFRTTSAFNLIGRDVKSKIPTDNTGKNFEEFAGKVDGVRMEKGNIYVQIGAKEVPIESIYQVN